MNAYEHFACNEYLSWFPNDKTFDEVMEMLRTFDDDVAVWDAFSNFEVEEVIDLIDNLVENLKTTFIPRPEVKQ